MPTYVVSYDLNRPGQDYQELYNALKSCKRYWHVLDSTWIIVTDEGASNVRDRLMIHLDKNDKLIVVQSSGVAAWYGFSDEGNLWLKNNL